jgi:hypothetical protein
MTRWQITRTSVTRAAVCLLLAVGIMFLPFEELSHARRGGLYRTLGSILGEGGAKFTGALILVALGIYSLESVCPKVPKAA